MRIRDDGITPHNSSLSAASTKRERDRVRGERDTTRTKKRRKQTPTHTQREKEIGKFSMVGFDSSTSSFLALLVNKSNRN